jgi:DNA-binding transcriptional regulator YhcF (GntR family)
VSTPAPYRRIAAEIGGRIAAGELRPGDTVPSTRAITRQWGVAMATATKAIATLRDAGLVETKSGAGTVVRSAGALPKRTTPSEPKERDISRARIVRAAIAIADTEGIGALSMRRVATSLDIATMSLYRHVPGKDELTLLMVDTVFGDTPFPAQRPAHWRAALEFAARLMWRTFRAHPWAAELVSMTRPQLLPNMVDYLEWTVGTLRSLGMAADTTLTFHLTLFGHVRGTAMNLHSESQAEQDTGLTADEWLATQETDMRALLASGGYPGLRWVVEQDYDNDLDRLFEFGLGILLDGVQARLRQRVARR